MAVRIIHIVTIVLNVLHCAYTEHVLCNVTKLGDCRGAHRYCSEATGRCECLDGYESEGQQCVTGAVSHDATAAVVSIFTIALVVAGLVVVIRKYNLIEYARQKLRRSNDVMYEDVMIGQDDPPLVP